MLVALKRAPWASPEKFLRSGTVRDTAHFRAFTTFDRCRVVIIGLPPTGSLISLVNRVEI